MSSSEQKSEQEHKQQNLDFFEHIQHFFEHARHFIHKTCINQDVCQVSRCSRAMTKRCTKKRDALAKLCINESFAVSLG